MVSAHIYAEDEEGPEAAVGRRWPVFDGCCLDVSTEHRFAPEVAFAGRESSL